MNEGVAELVLHSSLLKKKKSVFNKHRSAGAAILEGCNQLPMDCDCVSGVSPAWATLNLQLSSSCESDRLGCFISWTTLKRFLPVKHKCRNIQRGHFTLIYVFWFSFRGHCCALMCKEYIDCTLPCCRAAVRTNQTILDTVSLSPPEYDLIAVSSGYMTLTITITRTLQNKLWLFHVLPYGLQNIGLPETKPPWLNLFPWCTLWSSSKFERGATPRNSTYHYLYIRSRLPCSLSSCSFALHRPVTQRSFNKSSYYQMLLRFVWWSNINK